WPAGNFVLLPSHHDASVTVRTGLDRLRWLFAGTLDLVVLNLEPAFAAACTDCLQPRIDEASVRQLMNPQDDPTTLFGRSLPAPARERSVSVRPARSGLVPRCPVVFCHGMLAMTTLRRQLPEDLNCFSALREFLRERGFRALFPQVAPTG